MIALLSLFEHVQVGILIFLLGPSGAVNPLQHLILAITAPIRASELHKLEYLELSSRWYVGATAEVSKFALGVKRDLFILRNTGNDLGFIDFTLLFEKLNRLITRHHMTNDGLIFLCQLQHFFLKGSQVIWGEGSVIREVVIEAVLNHRTNGDLRIGEQFFNSIRE